MNRLGIIGCIGLIGLSGPAWLFAQTAPAGIVFTNEPQTIISGGISETITIQVQDSSGALFKLPSTGCISLSSSAAGEFSSSVTNWSAVSVLTMNKNSANRNFYYRSSVSGTQTLTARLALKPTEETRSCANWPISEWPTGWTTSQKITIEGSGVESPPSQPTPFSKGGGSEAGGGFSAEPVPSLLVKPSGPLTAIVGADAEFSAQVFGTKKEKIENARVIWSFGNGATREGNKVRYAYTIPGSYAVIVSAASGELSGYARILVKAVSPEITISRVSSGPDGFIEIENKSGAELDISGWGIASGVILFAIPERTFLLPKTKVAFPASATGVFVVNNDARLLFPNGKLAAEYEPSIHTFSEMTSKNPLPPSPPPLVKEGEGGGFNTSNVPASVILSENDSSNKMYPWIFGIAGVAVLGIAGLAAFKFKQKMTEEKTDEEQFAEDVRINSF